MRILHVLDHSPAAPGLHLARFSRLFDRVRHLVETGFIRAPRDPAEVPAEELGTHVQAVLPRQRLEVGTGPELGEHLVRRRFVSHQDVTKPTILLGLGPETGGTEHQRQETEKEESPPRR